MDGQRASPTSRSRTGWATSSAIRATRSARPRLGSTAGARWASRSCARLTLCATCRLDIHQVAAGEAGFGISKQFFEVKKDQINDELGIVVGWAITCTKDGQPYYDLNVDRDGASRASASPSTSTTTEMFKAAPRLRRATELRATSCTRARTSASSCSCSRSTDDIYKALFGVEHHAPITGLAVGYKPPPDVLAKFKSGELRGFSIEGWHEDSELIEDA
jgi:hypothetical protein